MLYLNSYLYNEAKEAGNDDDDDDDDDDVFVAYNC